jgi:hypothetical protein
MNKEAWLWVVIRAFGVYLLTLFIIALPPAIYSVYSLFSIDDTSCMANAGTTNDLGSVISDLSKFQKGSAIKSIVQLFIYGCFGNYFVFHGALLHKILNRESPV